MICWLVQVLEASVHIIVVVCGAGHVAVTRGAVITSVCRAEV